LNNADGHNPAESQQTGRPEASDEARRLASLSDRALSWFQRKTLTQSSPPPLWLAKIISAVAEQAGSKTESLRVQLVSTIIAGIRAVSADRDREDVLQWFGMARSTLGDPKLTKTEVATQLYGSIDTLRVAKLIINIVTTSLRNFQHSNLPLSLKIALPVTAIGTAIVGAEGAGIAAFGGAIGAPVALLLFLGTAGATSVLEAFVKDHRIRDPLTKLMLKFVEFETTRRARKELLDTIRADAMTPERNVVPSEQSELQAALLQMDPVEFERHVMSFFAESGYPTGLTARSNDYGVDGYVFHPDGLIVVQCKKYSPTNPVGRPTIQQFKGVVEEQGALRGYVVTTSRFTDEAIESAEKSPRIVLVDCNQLCKWHETGFRMD
jgi:restriction system protein